MSWPIIKSEVADRRQPCAPKSPETDVQVELTQAVFKGLLPTVISSALALVGSTMTIAHHYRARGMWEISVAMIIASAFRGGVVIAFLRGSHQLSASAALFWGRLYGYSIMCYCSTMAAVTLYTFSHHYTSGYNLCLLGLFMFSVGVGGRSGLDPIFTHISLFIMLGSLAFAFYQVHEVFFPVDLLLIILFWYSVYASVEGKHDLLLDQLRAKRRFRILTQQDALTGLANRRYFEDCLKAACCQSTPFALLFIDLDRFKQVNDTYGHSVGDEVLKSVAGRLRAVVREGDLMARLGGDEFAVLQHGVSDRTSVTELAARINESLSCPLPIEDLSIHIGASIGIRLSSAQENDPLRLLSLADEALYRVKQSGRGSFAFS
jgi:diguanylate cyclase (GGDEF)-like protein